MRTLVIVVIVAIVLLGLSLSFIGSSEASGRYSAQRVVRADATNGISGGVYLVRCSSCFVTHPDYGLIRWNYHGNGWWQFAFADLNRAIEPGSSDKEIIFTIHHYGWYTVSNRIALDDDSGNPVP